MICIKCGEVFDEEVEGATISDKFTSEEHNFCSMHCLFKWVRDD